MNIPGTDCVSDLNALQRMRKENDLLITVKSRKPYEERVELVMRNNLRHGLRRLVLPGKIEGDMECVGEERYRRLNYLRDWSDLTELFHTSIVKENNI